MKIMKKLFYLFLIIIYLVSGLFVSYKAVSLHREYSRYFEVVVTGVYSESVPQFRGVRTEYYYSYFLNNEKLSEQIDYTEYKSTKVGDVKTVFIQTNDTWTVEQVIYTVLSVVWLMSLMVIFIINVSK